MNLDHFWNLPVEDQNQYFGKTFFKIKAEDRPPIWFHCLGFLGRNNAKGNIEGFQGIDVVDLTTWVPQFDFPDSGLYNFGASSVYFQKIPARQPKKGVSPDTAAFDSFRQFLKLPVGANSIIKEYDLRKMWELDGIVEIFNDSHDYGLADSFLFMSKKKRISFAINRKFALGLGITSHNYNLWYKRILVGEVPSPKEVVLFPTMFEQEVFDHFHEEATVHRGVAAR